MSRNPDVDAWFERYDNPQKPLVQQVREAILAVDERVDETIKWHEGERMRARPPREPPGDQRKERERSDLSAGPLAPTFVFRGNIASFFPKAKQHVTLMFH